MAQDSRPVILLMFDDIRASIAQGDSTYNVGLDVLFALTVGLGLSLVTMPLWILTMACGKLAKWWFGGVK